MEPLTYTSGVQLKVATSWSCGESPRITVARQPRGWPGNSHIRLHLGRTPPERLTLTILMAPSSAPLILPLPAAPVSTVNSPPPSPQRNWWCRSRAKEDSWCARQGFSRIGGEARTGTSALPGFLFQRSLACVRGYSHRNLRTSKNSFYSALCTFATRADKLPAKNSLTISSLNVS